MERDRVEYNQSTTLGILSQVLRIWFPQACRQLTIISITGIRIIEQECLPHRLSRLHEGKHLSLGTADQVSTAAF
jgi:hypothetical protein